MGQDLCTNHTGVASEIVMLWICGVLSYLDMLCNGTAKFVPTQWRIKDFRRGGDNLVGGRQLLSRLRFVKFVCRNERISTLRGGTRRRRPPRIRQCNRICSPLSEFAVQFTHVLEHIYFALEAMFTTVWLFLGVEALFVVINTTTNFTTIFKSFYFVSDISKQHIGIKTWTFFPVQGPVCICHVHQFFTSFQFTLPLRICHNDFSSETVRQPVLQILMGYHKF